MAMNMSATGGIRSDINITPLVDVVLVLLIIFMVAVPLLQMGYPAQVPPKVTTATPPPSEDQIIVRMDITGQTFINKQAIPYANFGGAISGTALQRVDYGAFQGIWTNVHCCNCSTCESGLRNHLSYLEITACATAVAEF